MFQTIAIQHLYMGCFGVGFLFFTVSLFLSGGRVKVSRAGGRGGQTRIGGRGAAGRAGNSPRIGTAKAGGARGAAKVAGAKAPAGRAPAKAAGRSAAKAGGKGGKVAAKGAKAPGNTKSGDTHTETHGIHLPHAGEHSESLSEQTFVKSHDSSQENDFKDQVFFFLMGIINPTTIAMSVFLFGAAGLAIINYFPDMSKSSFLPAGILAFIFTMFFQNMLGWFASKIENSALHILDDAIGTIGEITVPIPHGKTGEVMFVLGEGRKNYSAKCLNADKDIKRGTKVIIIDLEGSLAHVEPYDDIYIDEEDLLLSQ